MTKPVGGGSQDQPDPSVLSSQQRKPGGDAASQIAEGVLRSRESSPSAPLSSRVSAGEVRPSKGDILNQWFASQPEDAKEEAKQIVDFLRGIDLENPFEIKLPSFKKISLLPEVFQKCVGFDILCSSLVFPPMLPACRKFSCMLCQNLQMVLPLPKCLEFWVLSCKSLYQICDLTECERFSCIGCSSLVHLPEKLPSCLNLT